MIMIKKLESEKKIIYCFIIRGVLGCIVEDAQDDQRQPYWGEESY